MTSNIVKLSTRIKKLKKLTEVLGSKIRPYQSVAFRGDFEYVVLDNDSDTYCIYIDKPTGFYKMYIDRHQLYFKSVNSIVDFIEHTYIEDRTF